MLDLFYSRMTKTRREALNGMLYGAPCATEVVPMIDEFYNRCIQEQEKKENDNTWLVEKIFETAKYLANNTRSPLYSEEVTYIKRIFEELETLFTSTRDKVMCINEIVCKNQACLTVSEENKDWRDGMLFEFKTLYAVIHRVNTEWVDLCKRGFSLMVFLNFWKAFSHEKETGVEKSEEEKMNDFMSLLDGTKKFVPVYQLTHVSFKVVDPDFQGIIIEKIDHCAMPSIEVK